MLRRSVARSAAFLMIAGMFLPASAEPMRATALHAAAARDDVAALRQLLRQGAAIDARDESGATALLVDAHGNRIGAARALIEAGANVNAKDNSQDSASAAQKSLGIAVIPLTPSIANQVGVGQGVRGVVVTAVDPSTDAGSKGLRRGDVILSADNRPVLSQADLDRAVAAVKSSGRAAVLLQIQRGSQRAIFVPVRLKD